MLTKVGPLVAEFIHGAKDLGGTDDVLALVRGSRSGDDGGGDEQDGEEDGGEGLHDDEAVEMWKISIWC